MTYGPADIGQALALASSLGQRRDAGRLAGPLRVFLFTDGAYGAIAGAEADNLDIRLVQIGNSGQNQGITALSARADPQNVNRYQVFARVRNFADRVPGTLALNVDGNLAESREVTLAPTATTPPPPSTSSPTCRPARGPSRRSWPGTDVYLDNSAYTVLDVGRRPRSCWSPTATSSWRRC